MLQTRQNYNTCFHERFIWYFDLRVKAVKGIRDATNSAFCEDPSVGRGHVTNAVGLILHQKCLKIRISMAHKSTRIPLRCTCCLAILVVFPNLYVVQIRRERLEMVSDSKKIFNLQVGTSLHTSASLIRSSLALLIGYFHRRKALRPCRDALVCDDHGVFLVFQKFKERI